MLTVAVSSRALFDLREANELFEQAGAYAFDEYMRTYEDEPLSPGAAFPLVAKLLALNTPGVKRNRVEVILLSRNSPDAGIRVMKSVMHYGLDIERAVFTQGKERFRYAKAMGAQLFLSANAEDVRAALKAGVASATLVLRDQVKPPQLSDALPVGAIRIAFDGDAVLFADDAERVNLEQGLLAFRQSEKALARTPLNEGPFRPVLEALHAIQQEYPANECPIRIALVTARGVEAHERVLRTLREWGVHVDEALFTGGQAKGPLLDAFGADMFFDDAMKNVENAADFVVSGHVPNGVRNEIV